MKCPSIGWVISMFRLAYRLMQSIAPVHLSVLTLRARVPCELPPYLWTRLILSSSQSGGYYGNFAADRGDTRATSFPDTSDDPSNRPVPPAKDTARTRASLPTDSNAIPQTAHRRDQPLSWESYIAQIHTAQYRRPSVGDSTATPRAVYGPAKVLPWNPSVAQGRRRLPGDSRTSTQLGHEVYGSADDPYDLRGMRQGYFPNLSPEPDRSKYTDSRVRAGKGGWLRGLFNKTTDRSTSQSRDHSRPQRRFWKAKQSTKGTQSRRDFFERATTGIPTTCIDNVKNFKFPHRRQNSSFSGSGSSSESLSHTTWKFWRRKRKGISKPTTEQRHHFYNVRTRTKEPDTISMSTARERSGPSTNGLVITPVPKARTARPSRWSKVRNSRLPGKFGQTSQTAQSTQQSRGINTTRSGPSYRSYNMTETALRNPVTMEMILTPQDLRDPRIEDTNTTQTRPPAESRRPAGRTPSQWSGNDLPPLGRGLRA